MSPRYDIVLLADPRFPGGSSTALASEIRAAAAAGYRAALVPLAGAVLRRPHPFHPELRALIDGGACELVAASTPLSCGLLEIHHPQLLTFLPQQPLRITAEQRLLIVHHPPFAGDGTPFYDVAAIARTVHEALGTTPLWAPVGPLVRAQLEALPDHPPLLAEDWVNILDPLPFAGPREQPNGGPVRIGRHSRPDPLKWPADRAAVLEAYPDDPRFVVRVLGGGRFLAELMGEPLPRSWQVEPFAPGTASRFLRELDAYVYYFHPRWVEAFGRAVLEALAAGCPAILPEALAPLFGEVAIIAARRDAPTKALELCADRTCWRERSEAGRAFVRERFAPPVHVKRIEHLIGAPRSRAVASGAPPRPVRILFFTSNGIGLGHLTRCLAMARRLPAAIEPVFVSLSQAVHLLQALGYPCDHLPFHAQQGLDQSVWNRSLRRSLAEVLAAWRPRVVVFDGNTPYGGLIATLAALADCWRVWSRRGLWRDGHGAVALEREAAFDLVIEPGELAGAWDRGPTSLRRERTRVVAPLRLLDEAEALPRPLARQALQLPETATVILMQLGSGNNFDFRSVAQRCAALLAGRRDCVVVAVDSPIAAAPLALPRGVLRRQVFPLARYLPAFDAAISAVGYNSFHELLVGGVPTLLIPNENPMMDDQLLRARYALRRGLALHLRVHELHGLPEALAELLDPSRQAELRRSLAALDRSNGAAEAATLLSELAVLGRADCA